MSSDAEGEDCVVLRSASFIPWTP